MARELIGAHQKALAINLEARKYGAFAEIGAGQEVVRWFFRVGGAAGTIAKSMSAYDMVVSDAIYGACARYVSRERLLTMLDHEYDLLVERLDTMRGENTEFFAFADTVRAQSYHGSSECHGWLGIRFQTAPRKPPSDIVIHVRMLDKENVQQQEALGMIGINLIHGAFNYHQDPDTLLECLLDNLSTERIEVDMVQFTGPDFVGIDHRLLSLKLVQLGLSNAAMFSADGTVLQPSEVLHKKPILVERGSFRPVTNVHLDMLECARAQFVRDPAVNDHEVVVLMELTMKSLRKTGEIDYQDFLARADLLAAGGATVLISNYFEFYRLAAYLSRYTQKKIGITMGMPSLQDLFDEKFYENLDGGILEAFGRLFKTDLKLFVYPWLDPNSGHLVNVERLKVAPHLRNLCQHLVENGFIESIDFYNRDYLAITSDDVLRRIAAGDPSWKKMVPPQVARTILERCYFGCCSVEDGSGEPESADSVDEAALPPLLPSLEPSAN